MRFAVVFSLVGLFADLVLAAGLETFSFIPASAPVAAVGANATAVYFVAQDTVGVVDAESKSWAFAVAVTDPRHVESAATTVDGDRLWAIGGLDASGAPTTDSSSFDAPSRTWTPATPLSAGDVPVGAGATTADDATCTSSSQPCVFRFGGTGATVPSLHTTSNPQGAPLATIGLPNGADREGASVASSGSNYLVFGGHTSDGTTLGDSYVLTTQEAPHQSGISPVVDIQVATSSTRDRGRGEYAADRNYATSHSSSVPNCVDIRGNKGTVAWVRFDLLTTRTVREIELTRNSCCPQNIEGLKVSVGDDGGDPYGNPLCDGDSLGEPNTYFRDPDRDMVNDRTRFSCVGVGRYVFVFMDDVDSEWAVNYPNLRFCELEVRAEPLLWASLGHPVTASSEVPGTSTTAVTDGTVLSSHETCSQTRSDDTDPWLRIDLLREHNLAFLDVTTRNDWVGGVEHINPFEVFVGNTENDYSANTRCTPGELYIPNNGYNNRIVFGCPARGRYVFFHLADKAPGEDRRIQVCEAKVYAHPDAPVEDLMRFTDISFSGNELACCGAGRGQANDLKYMQHDACPRTGPATDARMRIDLPSPSYVQWVRVWAFVNAATWYDAAVNQGLRVRIGDTSNFEAATECQLFTVPGTSHDDPPMAYADIQCGLTGQYIWVYAPGSNTYMSTCEFQVFGHAVDGSRTHVLLSPHRPTGGTPAFDERTVDRAVDTHKQGNLNTDRQGYHSVKATNPWLRVELEEASAVNRFRFITRTDCCQSRSTPFYVAVGFNPTGPELNRQLGPFSLDTTTWTADIVLDPEDYLFGKYVFLFLRKTDFLQVIEFEVWGTTRMGLTWEEVVTDVPSPRSHAPVASIGDVAFLFGGVDANGSPLTDLHAFSFASNSWTRLPVDAALPDTPITALAATSPPNYLIAASGDTAYTLDVRCPALDLPTGVSAACTTERALLSECTFSCKDTSTMRTHTDAAVCTPPNSQWSVTPPQCLPPSPNPPTDVTAQLDPAGSGFLLVEWTPPVGGEAVGGYNIRGDALHFRDDFDGTTLNAPGEEVWRVDAGTAVCDTTDDNPDCRYEMGSMGTRPGWFRFNIKDVVNTDASRGQAPFLLLHGQHAKVGTDFDISTKVDLTHSPFPGPHNTYVKAALAGGLMVYDSVAAQAGVTYHVRNGVSNANAAGERNVFTIEAVSAGNLIDPVASANGGVVYLRMTHSTATNSYKFYWKWTEPEPWKLQGETSASKTRNDGISKPILGVFAKCTNTNWCDNGFVDFDYFDLRTSADCAPPASTSVSGAATSSVLLPIPRGTPYQVTVEATAAANAAAVSAAVPTLTFASQSCYVPEPGFDDMYVEGTGLTGPNLRVLGSFVEVDLSTPRTNNGGTAEFSLELAPGGPHRDTRSIRITKGNSGNQWVGYRFPQEAGRTYHGSAWVKFEWEPSLGVDVGMKVLTPSFRDESFLTAVTPNKWHFHTIQWTAVDAVADQLLHFTVDAAPQGTVTLIHDFILQELVPTGGPTCDDGGSSLPCVGNCLPSVGGVFFTAPSQRRPADLPPDVHQVVVNLDFSRERAGLKPFLSSSGGVAATARVRDLSHQPRIVEGLRFDRAGLYFSDSDFGTFSRMLVDCQPACDVNDFVPTWVAVIIPDTVPADVHGSYLSIGDFTDGASVGALDFAVLDSPPVRASFVLRGNNKNMFGRATSAATPVIAGGTLSDVFGIAQRYGDGRRHVTLHVDSVADHAQSCLGESPCASGAVNMGSVNTNSQEYMIGALADGRRPFRGHILEIVQYDRSKGVLALQNYVHDKYYLRCRDVSHATAVDDDFVSEQNYCSSGGSASDNSRCRQACGAGLVAAFGDTVKTCSVGSWSSSSLVCAEPCVTLPPPANVGGCVKTQASNTFADAAEIDGFQAVPPIPAIHADTAFSVVGGNLVLDTVSLGGTGDVCDVPALVFGYSSPHWRNLLVPNVALNVSARMEVTSLSGGLAWRVTDEGTQYRLELSTDTTSQAMWRYQDGEATQLVKLVRDFPSGFHDVLVVVEGLTFTVFVDDELWMTYTEDASVSLPSTGTVGVYVRGALRVDTLTVTSDCDAMACGNAVEGTTCAWTCAEGFVPKGTDTRTCSAGGLWSGTTFGCAAEPPLFENTERYVEENSAVDTEILPALVAIPPGANIVATYRMMDGASAFEVGACSGVMRVTSPTLDFETQNVYMVVVRALSNGDPDAFTDANVTVHILDVNDPPTMEDQVVEMAEGAVEGVAASLPIVASDPDGDPQLFSIFAVSDAGLFVFNASSNGLGTSTELLRTGTGELDFEGSQPLHFLTVTVTDTLDTSLSATATVTVALTDSPEPPLVAPGQLVVVDEYAFTTSGGGAGLVSATDPDFGDAAAFELVATAGGVLSGDGQSSDFAAPAEPFSINTTTGEVSVQTTVPLPDDIGIVVVDGRQTRAHYTLSVRVTDPGGLQGTGDVRLVVLANVTTTAQPFVEEFDGLAVGLLPTAGGIDVRFVGGNLVTGQAYTATLSPHGFTSNCSAESASVLVCASPAGAGTKQSWSFVETESGDAVATVNLLVSSFAAPVVREIVPGTNVTLDALNTLGGEQVFIVGQGFGPVVDRVLVQAGAEVEVSEEARTGRAVFSLDVVAVNDTHIQVSMPPGAGSGLAVWVSVSGQAQTFSAETLTYTEPRVTSVVGEGVNVDAGALVTGGGQALLVSGSGFGPSGTSLGVVVRLVGNIAASMSCQRSSATPDALLRCVSPAGVGRGAAVEVMVEDQSDVRGDAVVSYAPPTVLTVTGPGAVAGNTAGGDTVLITGQNFGPAGVEGSLGSVLYGKGNNASLWTFAASECRVVDDNRVVQCVTGEGTGRGLNWQVTVGGQPSNVAEVGTAYAAPIVASFSGVGATMADTNGGQPVLISGSNFGPDLSLLTAVYTYELAGEDGDVLLFDVNTTTCVMVTAHEEVQCNTVEGAGAVLRWSLTVDDQVSTSPFTSYAEPEVHAVYVAGTTTPVADAPTNGGLEVDLVGVNFGPSSPVALMQSVTYGPGNDVSVYMPLSWTVVDHEHVRLTLAPGVGSDLRFSVVVADTMSPPSSASFSFALPHVTAVSPSTASTLSDERFPTRVTVTGVNFGLLDPQASTFVAIGNLDDGSLQALLPTSVESTSPEAVSVSLPSGLGVGRAVRVVTLSALASQPAVEDVVTNARPVVGDVDVFSYEDPEVEFVTVQVVTLSTDVSAAAAALGVDVDTVTAGDYRRLDVFGTNFGPSADDTGDSVARSVQLEVGAVWVDGVIGCSHWSHSQLVCYTAVTSGNLRVVLTSTQYDGSVAMQVSNEKTYLALSPALRAGSFDVMPTSGGPVISLLAENLESTELLRVTVGGADCPLVDPADHTVDVPLNSTAIADAIIFPNGESSGDFPDGFAWEVTCRVPEGQGVSQEVVLFRDDTPSTGALSLDYEEPAILSVVIEYDELDADGVVSASIVDVVDVSGTAGPTLSIPTAGARVTLNGTNLGACPTLEIGLLPVAFCPGLTGGAVSRSHTAVVVDIGAGEGVGPLAGAASVPWSLTFRAGTQEAAPLDYSYQAPVVLRVSPPSGSTSGGFPITVFARNLGLSVPTVTFEYAASGSFVLSTCGSPVVGGGRTTVTCSAPAGSGRDLGVVVSVAGQASSPITAGDGANVFSYDPPMVTGVSVDGGGVVPVVGGGGVTPLALNTSGQAVTVWGNNFGGLDPAAHCTFVEWASRIAFSGNVLTCNDEEDFLGEGEVADVDVLSHAHDHVTVMVPAGVGVRHLQVSIRGQVLAEPVVLEYAAPVVDAIVAMGGSTDGGDVVELYGGGFGHALNVLDADGVGSEVPPTFPLPLPISSTLRRRMPMAAHVIHFHTKCLSASQTLGLTADTVQPHTAAADCEADAVVTVHGDSHLSFLSPSGIGVNRSVTVSIVEDTMEVVVSNTQLFHYDPPEITRTSPFPVRMGGSTATGDTITTALLQVEGNNFGLLADAGDWTEEERLVGLSVGGAVCTADGLDTAERVTRRGAEVMECVGSALPVGYANVSLQVAGQSGFMPNTDGRSFFFVCDDGAYGRPGEACFSCPSGAVCEGFIADVRVNFTTAYGRAPLPGEFQEGDGFHAYPRPLPGWFNLNGSLLATCPSAYVVPGGRDVCVVPCEPEEACVGDNFCTEAYTGDRCGDCADRFYRRGGLCKPCPDSAWLLIVMFGVVAIAACVTGYILNKKDVNVAFVSIGVDYFQVLAIFANSRVEWPSFIEDLLHYLSAFNLNLEITAPECSIPDLKYKTKWFFIQGLPIAAMAVFTVLFVLNVAYDRIVKGQRGSSTKHLNALTSPAIVMMYFLYLYITRTIIDVFNCSPIIPPNTCPVDLGEAEDVVVDDTEYLQVGVLEKCGEPGGLQMTLLPFAITAFFVYTIGYPAFVGYKLWKLRSLVMEDQLLRAMGTGNTKVSNPQAFNIRRRYHKLYYLFKPDYFFWILVIIGRKFFIAFVALVFNKNAAFQLSMALLVMFAAYALQVKYRPFLAPSEHEEVLMDHRRQSYLPGSIHARLAVSLGKAQNSNRRKARSGNMSGVRERAKAVVGSLLFNYNTVEAVLLGCAVLVCLSGIMFESGRFSSGQFTSEKSTVEAFIVILIFGSIVYFFTVLFIEVATLCGADVCSGSETKQQKKRKKGHMVGGDDSTTVTVMEPMAMASNQVNPMFQRAVSKRRASSAASHDFAKDTLLALDTAPDDMTWQLFKSSYQQLSDSVEKLRSELAVAKTRAHTLSSASAGDDEGSLLAARGPPRARRQFKPRRASLAPPK